MSGEKLSLFTSIAVNKQPKTDKQTELVRLITNQVSKSGIGNFSQLVQDLDAAGIVIGKDRIAIKAKQTDIVDNNGNTIAMFSNGKLNASLIDAETITVNHLYAKSAQGGTSVGHFGNYDIDAAKISGVGYPLWLGASTAANAPFRVSKDGDMVANSGQVGPFWISPSVFKDCIVSGNFESDPSTSRFTSYVKLSKSSFELVGKNSISADIASEDMCRVLISKDSKIDSYHTPMYIKSYSLQGYTAGITIDALGGPYNYGCRAINARFGSYGGFRRDIYSIKQTESFNAASLCLEGYGLVFCTNTTAITVTCPTNDNLQAGDELIIIRGVTNITLSGTLRVVNKTGITKSKTYTTPFEWIHLIYSGDASCGWFVECSGD